MSEHDSKLATMAELFPAKIPRRHKIVPLPVSGNRVRIQSLTEREQSEYEMAVIAHGSSRSKFVRSKLLDANRRLIALCLVDAAGSRLLSDNQANQLATWDSADANFLHDEVAAHCGINREAIEDLVKNSEGIAVDSPPTDSPPE